MRKTKKKEKTWELIKDRKQKTLDEEEVSEDEKKRM